MADDPSKTPGTPAKSPSPQNIPLAKIHDLPGVFIPKQPDKSYGGLVSSIQASGVKEPVILRLREDGKYQLVAGYRRRRGSELAKKQDIGLPGVHVECKRNERLNLLDAMAQAVRDSDKFGDGAPAVFHRRSRSGWLVAMRLQDWISIYGKKKDRRDQMGS